MKRTFFLIGACALIGVLLLTLRPHGVRKVAVVCPVGATALEGFSAKEIQRYLYLRTGILADLINSDEVPARYDGCILVAKKGRELLKKTGDAEEILRRSNGLNNEDYLIETNVHTGSRQHVIAGGDDAGVLYGAYRFIEATGVRFAFDSDVIPEGGYDLSTLKVNETGKPLFKKRGTQPFHDFNVGPDWWNAQDYKNVLSQMAKMRMNFIGFHTYPSWNPAAGPEANVWIGLPEDVDEQGDVKSGYEAGVVTTRRGWEVKPFPTNQYACGAGLLFEADEYAPDFMLDCIDWPKTDSSAAKMFNRYGDFQQDVFEDAHRLGIRTCVGTELPLGVPKSLALRLKSKGMKPDDQSVLRRLYEGTFLRLMRKMPVDCYWFWLPESWLWWEPGYKGWEITTEKNTEREIALIDSAARAVKAPFDFATSGWRLGTIKDPFWTDKRTPKTWAISSINVRAGRDPVEKSYGEIVGRPKWAIGWAEDDDAARAHCCTCWDLQFWVERMFGNSADALRYGCEGMLAIHWRTASIAPNMAALAGAGWQIEHPADPDASQRESGRDSLDSFWEEWGRSMFGGDAGVEAGRQLQKFDGGHLAINAMINGGWNTTDSAIVDFFAPRKKLESLRGQIKGSGNLERLDYWINYVRASESRVRTWVLSSRLDSVMARAKSLQENDARTRFAREEALPLRLSVARSYEEMISAFVACARTPAEVGTISSIESGNRHRVVTAHDSTLAGILGAPLPGEASLTTAYRGSPRIFVSSACTQWRVGEQLEIRPFVLSADPCKEVNLYWRFLGEKSFRKVAAVHRARQAYRVALPTQREGTLEYYIEAELENGTRIQYPATAPSVNQTVILW